MPVERTHSKGQEGEPNAIASDHCPVIRRVWFATEAAWTEDEGFIAISVYLKC